MTVRATSATVTGHDRATSATVTGHDRATSANFFTINYVQDRGCMLQY